MGSIINQPKVNVNIVPATTDVSNAPQRILFVGQKVAAGTATAGALNENILNDNSEDTLFGANSQLAGMIRAAKRLNQVTQMDAIALDDDGSGVAATGSIALSGTATEAGTLKVRIGSQELHEYSISVASGDTATVIGDAIDTAVAADTDAPFSTTNTTGTVAVTADNDGTVGNYIGIEVSGTVGGVTSTVTGMSGGATDPTLTGVFDVVGNKRHQTIVWPYADDTSVLKTFLDARFNDDVYVLDGVGVTANHDSLANHLAALNALNSQSLVWLTDKAESETNFKGPAVFEMPQNKAAEFAAIRGLRLTESANISQFVITTNGPLDSFGGPALASKPYFNTTFPHLPLVKTGRGWNNTEIEQLHDAGGTVLGINSAGNTAIAGEVVTTYKTDSAGNTDISFKYLNYVDTASNAREYFFNNLRSRFAQSRLTEGDVLPGRDMANDLTIASYCEKLYGDLAGPDYVLLQAGEDALKFFKDNLSVTLDLANGRATIQMTAPLVTQLREILATFKIAFSTEG
jgi:phage tail sheath gpL-like